MKERERERKNVKEKKYCGLIQKTILFLVSCESLYIISPLNILKKLFSINK